MTSTKGRKRDVCPACDEHHEQVKVSNGSNVFVTQYKCTGCGHVHGFCDLKYNDNTEREAAYQRKLAYHREWCRKNIERNRYDAKRWYRQNRDKIRRYNRERYKNNKEFRERKNNQSKEWSANNPERRAEICRRYYENHKYDILFKQKERRLKELRDSKKA